MERKVSVNFKGHITEDKFSFKKKNYKTYLDFTTQKTVLLDKKMKIMLNISMSHRIYRNKTIFLTRSSNPCICRPSHKVALRRNQQSNVLKIIKPGKTVHIIGRLERFEINYEW